MNVIYARPMIRTRRKVSSRRDRIWGRIFRKLTKGTPNLINKQQVICAYSDKYRSRSVFEGARMNVIYARPMIRTRRKVSSRRDRIWGRIFRKLTKGISHPAKGRRPYIRWRWLEWVVAGSPPNLRLFRAGGPLQPAPADIRPTALGWVAYEIGRASCRERGEISV